MNLIDAYVYEVTRRLPEKLRQDIDLELRAAIEDMLPEHYTEDDVKDALSKLGDPAVLAASYRDQPMYLIGPNVYDAYIWTLKKTIPWAILVTAIVHAVVGIMSFAGDEAILAMVLKAIGNIIANVIMVLMYVLFGVTAVFAAIERFAFSKEGFHFSKNNSSWTPDQLKKVDMIPKRKAISRGEVIFSFIWIIFWLMIYFWADDIVGIYQSVEGSGLQFVMPFFNQNTLLSFWPIIVLIAILELGLVVFKWRDRQWTLKLACANTIIHVMSFVVFLVIANAPNLLNPAIIPYMTQTMDTTIGSLTSFLDWIWRFIAVGYAVTIITETFDSFRKARKK